MAEHAKTHAAIEHEEQRLRALFEIPLLSKTEISGELSHIIRGQMALGN